MHESKNPDVGGLVVFKCAICDATGLATMDEELVPEGPSIYLCKACRARFQKRKRDILIYCMTCRRVTHMVTPTHDLTPSTDDGDRIMYVLDCSVPLSKAFKRSQLHDLRPDQRDRGGEERPEN